MDEMENINFIVLIPTQRSFKHSLQAWCMVRFIRMNMSIDHSVVSKDSGFHHM